MGLFSKRSSYQGGFAKYQDEIQRYGQTSQDVSRNNSINGAGAAAAAAMLRSQGNNPPVQRPARTSSLTNARVNNANNARTNSLKTYTYNPTPSYQPAGTAPRRYNSLTNKRQPHLQPQLELDDDEEEMVITTKTTKVVDSHGRTQSITTKTIKTLPDGSNIIETTTKNISRSNSRSNSLRSNSLLSNSNQNVQQINLSKIDEDLHDFDYNYMDDNLHLNQGPPVNHRLQSPPPPQPHTPPSPQDGHLRTKQDRHNSLGSAKPERANSITSSTSQQPLRSILKNTRKPRFDDYQPPTSPTSPEYHPYQNLVKSSPINDNESITSSGLIKFNNQVETIEIESRKVKPVRKSQILPQQQQFQQGPKQTSTVPDADFYAAAMAAAYKKVYGDRDPNAQPPIPEVSNSSPKLLSKPFSSPIDKVTKAVEKVEDQGITDKNYNYENHHKSFIGHSMRDAQIPKQSKHDDRVKLEEQAKKQSLKEELKAEKQAKKEAELLEKQARKDAKLSERENKKLQKSNKKFSGFFTRKKSVDSQSHSIPTTSSKGSNQRDVADTADSIHSLSFVRSDGNDQQDVVRTIPIVPIAPKLQPPITLEHKEPASEQPISFDKAPTLHQPILEHKEPTAQQPIIDSKDLNNARLPDNSGSPSSYNRTDSKDLNNARLPISNDGGSPSSYNRIDSKDLNNTRLSDSNNSGSPSSYNRIGRVIHSPERPKGIVFDSHDYQDSLIHRKEREATNVPPPEQRVDTVSENLDKGINSEAQAELHERPTTMDPGSPTVLGALLPPVAIDHAPHDFNSKDDTLTSTTSRDSAEYVDTVSPPANEIKKSIVVPSAVEQEPITNQPETRNYGYPDANVYDVDDTIKEDVNTGLIEPQVSEAQLPVRGVTSDNSNNRFSIFHDASSYPLQSPMDSKFSDNLQSPMDSNFSDNGLIKNEEFDKIVADSPEYMRSKEALVGGENIGPSGQHSEITKGNVDSEISSYSNDLTRMSKHSSAYYSRDSYYSDDDADADTTINQNPVSSYQAPRSEVPAASLPQLPKTAPRSELPTVSPPALPKATSAATIPAAIEDDILVGKNEVNVPSAVSSETNADPEYTFRIPYKSSRNTLNQLGNSEEVSTNKSNTVDEPSRNVQGPEEVSINRDYLATEPAKNVQAEEMSTNRTFANEPSRNVEGPEQTYINKANFVNEAPKNVQAEEVSSNRTNPVSEPPKNVQGPESVMLPMRYEAPPNPRADAVESVESMENNSLVNSAKEQLTVTPQSQSQENRNHADYPTTTIVETKQGKPKVKKVSKFKKAILKYFVNNYD